MKAQRTKKSGRQRTTAAAVATGTAEVRASHVHKVTVDGWTVLFECEARGRVKTVVERSDDFVLVHFDIPAGALGEYHLSVQQPCVDMQRSWVGAIDCWRGSELTSLALNYQFESSVNLQLPVICNYTCSGMNRGVIGLLDQVPRTRVHQHPILERPPMHLLQTKFTRSRAHGGFRETVVIGRQKMHFADAVQGFLAFCRRQQRGVPLPAPDWAREPVWCSWYSHLYMLTQQDVEAQLPSLQKLSVRTLLLDASWFMKPGQALHRESGDYVANRSAFRNLRSFVDRLHTEGFKVMVWCAPLYLGIHARKRRKLESACVWDGKERDYHLCPFTPEAIAHARDLTERVMRTYDLDGLKVDFLDDIGPTCVDPRHDHDDGNYGAAMCRFMGAIRDGVLAANPQAAIEYRVSYSTLASQPFATCHRGNDAPYDADYIRRENLFLRLFCTYPSAVWSDYAYWHANESLENIGLMLGMQIFSGGVPTLSLDFTQVGARVQQVVRRWLQFYARHRETLARAQLCVHSADSALSISSLHDEATRTAFVLLAGQHIPTELELRHGMRQAWILNASAMSRGALTLAVGKAHTAVNVTRQAPLHVTLR